MAKFEESIDISIELGIDPKKTEQNVKGSVNLPHSNGKKFKKYQKVKFQQKLK